MLKKTLTSSLGLGAVAGIFVLATSAHAAQLSPIPRDSSGQAVLMNQKNSKKYCRSVGKRIPTIKELALALNPKGVYESPVEGIPLSPVYKRDGSIDFYYDSSTYVQPSGDDGYWLWSSSGHPGSRYWGMSFGSYSGKIDYAGENSSYGSTVRCIERH